jgi:hypothetical protein
MIEFDILLDIPVIYPLRYFLKIVVLFDLTLLEII